MNINKLTKDFVIKLEKSLKSDDKNSLLSLLNITEIESVEIVENLKKVVGITNKQKHSVETDFDKEWREKTILNSVIKEKPEHLSEYFRSKKHEGFFIKKHFLGVNNKTNIFEWCLYNEELYNGDKCNKEYFIISSIEEE